MNNLTGLEKKKKGAKCLSIAHLHPSAEANVHDKAEVRLFANSANLLGVEGLNPQD